MFHFYRAAVRALQNQLPLKMVAPPTTKALYITQDEVNRAYADTLSHRYQVECESRSHLRPSEIPSDCNMLFWDADHVFFGAVGDITSSLETMLAQGGRIIIHTSHREKPSVQAFAGKPGVTIVCCLRDAFSTLQPASQRAPRHLPMIQAAFQPRRKAS